MPSPNGVSKDVSKSMSMSKLKNSSSNVRYELLSGDSEANRESGTVPERCCRLVPGPGGGGGGGSSLLVTAGGVAR